MKFKTILGALAVVVMLPMAGHCQPYSRTPPPQYQPIPVRCNPTFTISRPDRKWCANGTTTIGGSSTITCSGVRDNPESTLDYMLRTF